MVARGVALVPTVKQLDNFPQYRRRRARSSFPTYAAHMRGSASSAGARPIRAAYEAGVAIYAGTDAGGALPHGLIGGRGGRARRRTGCPPGDALGAASWRAREWLGSPTASTRATPADFVVYDADPPRSTIAVLRRILATVVLRGVVVRPGADGCRRRVARYAGSCLAEWCGRPRTRRGPSQPAVRILRD